MALVAKHISLPTGHQCLPQDPESGVKVTGSSSDQERVLANKKKGRERQISVWANKESPRKTLALSLHSHCGFLQEKRRKGLDRIQGSNLGPVQSRHIDSNLIRLYSSKLSQIWQKLPKCFKGDPELTFLPWNEAIYRMTQSSEAKVCTQLVALVSCEHSCAVNIHSLLEICVQNARISHPQIHILEPNSQCDGIWSWSLWELVCIKRQNIHKWHQKELRELSSSLHHVRTQQEGNTHDPRSRLSPNNKSAGILIKDFQPPEL